MLYQTWRYVWLPINEESDSYPLLEGPEAILFTTVAYYRDDGWPFIIDEVGTFLSASAMTRRIFFSIASIGAASDSPFL